MQQCLFVQAVEKILNSNVSDTVNIGTGIETKNQDILNIFCKIVGKNVDVDSVAKIDSIKSYDSRHWLCDTSYAKETYGIQCRTSIYKGLKDYINFMASKTF